MRRFLKGISLTLFVSTLLFLSIFQPPKTLSNIDGVLSVTKKPPLEERVLEQMTLEEKVGQLFMFGFSGTDVSKESSELITEKHIGGLILFGQNISDTRQLTTLINNFQNQSKIPLFISIDQEGGIVSRLKDNSVLTKAQKDISTPEEAYTIAKSRGEILREIGINMNFAPVVENISNPQSFLYLRAFRGSLDDITQKSHSSLLGYKDSQVIGVAKHFPGHSNSSPDSHYSLPRVYIKEDQWDEYIYPFKYLIEKDVVDLLMVGHILYPNIDDKPSTISETILTKKLRTKLGYDGVIISDDMEMDAIEKVGKYKDIAKESLLAGIDILLYSGLPSVQDSVYQYILESVKSGDISQNLIDEKVKRILRLKIQYGLIDFSILQPQD